MRRTIVLAFLVVCVVSLMCANLVKYLNNREYAAWEATNLAMAGLAQAIQYYHDVNSVVPTSLDSLVPEHYSPAKRASVSADCLQRPACDPILYIHVNEHCVVLVSGEEYWVVRCTGQSWESSQGPAKSGHAGADQDRSR